MYYTAYGGAAPPRTGASHAAIAPYGPYAAGDGGTVYLGLQHEREWDAFCRVVLERGDLATDARFDTNAHRVAHRDALDAEIARAFGRLTAAQVVERLDRAAIANARLNTMPEFVDHPQLAARGRWRTIASPAGPLKALLPPASVTGVEPVMGPVPDVGQHTDAILRELGFDAATIARWRDEAVI
jgi:crotonobetainyl-CoA:carnitine CoA-transferase CaiB-like acyl-CoA transferase